MTGYRHLLRQIRSIWAAPAHQGKRRTTRRKGQQKNHHDSSQWLGLEPLESRVLLSAVPTLPQISDVTLLAGSPLHIALNGSDAEGETLTYTASSSNNDVSTFVPEGNRSMRINVDGFGEMVFELFEGRASRVTDHIITLAERDFFDGVIFHRIINGFVIQGGDPTGTGTGGSDLGEFDDQFHFDLQHNRTGLLSMAKSIDDSNDSQFFITEVDNTEFGNSEVALRNLDFNHSVFGLLVEGETVRQSVSNVTVDANDRPLSDVVMNSVEIFVDNQNGVLMLSAPEGTTGSAVITVTVTDEEGFQVQQQFNVTIQADSFDGAPYLEDIPDPITPVDTQFTIQLQPLTVDVDDDASGSGFPIRFLDEVSLQSNGLPVPVFSHADLDYIVDFNTGEVTVTPTNGLTGIQPITVAVGRTPSAIDYQVIPVIIGAPTVTPDDALTIKRVDLEAYSDQNVNVAVNTLADDSIVHMVGNGWQKLDLSGFTVTENTILEFDFQSSTQGDIHAIGFDSDDDINNDNSQGFQLYGAETTWVRAIQDFNDYSTDAPGFKHYRIPVGEFFTGDFQFLTFVNDYDTIDPDAESVFANIQLYYEGATDLSPISAYSSQDDNPAVSLENSDGKIRITGNGWQKVDLSSIVITPNTVLGFDFQSSVQGEIHAIGFDNDDDISNSNTHAFQLYGTQTNWAPSIQDFNNYADDAPGVRHYQIPVGQFFTGEFQFLTFVNDHDVAGADAQSVYSNIRFFEVSLDPVDFNDFDLAAYSTQDAGPTLSVEDDGATVRITGNGWQRINLLSYTVTPDTILAFDFQSSVQGDIHAIGFDSDDDISNANTHAFQLYGTQTNWAPAIQDFNNYATAAPGVTRYHIRVGDFFTGPIDFLTFVNDHDVAGANAESVFSNIRLFELAAAPLNFNDVAISAYSTQNAGPAVSVEDDGATLRITGNGWQHVALPGYTITPNTILEFDFQSAVQGEIHAIGFDSDDDISNADTHAFQLYGTQTNWAPSLQDFNNYADDAPGVRNYRIRVGDFFTGPVEFLTFVNDHDVAGANAESVFSNINLFEDVINAVDVGTPGVEAYSTQDASPAIELRNDDSLIRIVGNGWQKLDLTNITITATTVLEFDFQSSVQGEIHAIGFDSDDDISNANTHAFQLYGTQTSWAPSLQDFNNYAGDAPGFTHYRIPVGEFFTGSFQFLTFVNDHDVAGANAESVFANIQIYDTIDLAGVAAYSTQDASPTITLEDNNTTLRIVGNGWQRLDLSNITITANTVLEFDFQSSVLGDIHAIGFDSDDDISNANTHAFQLYGTQTNWAPAIQDFHNYATSAPGVAHYRIPVGEFFTGDFQFLTFVNDHDVAGANAESIFSNIRLVEDTGG